MKIKAIYKQQIDNQVNSPLDQLSSSPISICCMLYYPDKGNGEVFFLNGIVPAPPAFAHQIKVKISK